MAISYVGSADLGHNGGTTNNLTVAYSVTAGSTLLRICFLGDIVGGLDDITSVTYAGVAATLEYKDTVGVGGQSNRIKYNYAIHNPVSGNNSVVISITPANMHYLLGGVSEYSGAGAFDATGEASIVANGSNSSVTASITTIADNCWIGALLEAYSGGTFAPVAGTGMTMRVTDAAFKSWGIGDSNGPNHPAGSYSMTGNSVATATRTIVLDLVSFSPSGPLPYRKFNQAYLRR